MFRNGGREGRGREGRPVKGRLGKVRGKVTGETMSDQGYILYIGVDVV